MQLGVGEALVSMLDEKGTPDMVARTLIAPPSARVGPITPEERQETIKRSSLLGKYDTAIDRESAFEVLQVRGEGRMGQAGAPQSGSPGPDGAPSQGGGLTVVWGWLAKMFTGGGTGKRQKMSPAELAMRSAVQSAARSAGTQIAHAILRGILGSMSSR
jgi:hypothetical protein